MPHWTRPVVYFGLSSLYDLRRTRTALNLQHPSLHVAVSYL